MARRKTLKVDWELGAVIPAAMLARLIHSGNDVIEVVEEADCLKLRAFDAVFDEQLGVGRQFKTAFRDAFKVCAND